MNFFTTPNSKNVIATLRIVTIEKSELTFLPVLYFYGTIIDLIRTYVNNASKVFVNYLKPYAKMKIPSQILCISQNYGKFQALKIAMRMSLTMPSHCPPAFQSVKQLTKFLNLFI